ncbi:hypothetical protein [Brevibacillus sp. VP]|uniref:hypothetical protein n=1 Tax=unclassified Brevibacillus TaxID=2684853 RepID=UPI000E2F4440|nr:hypothetical protein [Brevibacillus sp. VP]RFB28718.1 hypothetical protein DZB91_21170 [Brevibacillus sp. VP]
MVNKLKVSTLSIIASSLLLSSPVFAGTSDETNIDTNSGLTTTAIAESNIKKEQSIQPQQAKELWSASFFVEDYYLIPYDITDQSKIEVRTDTTIYTNDTNRIYDVLLMEYDSLGFRGGGFVEVKRETNPVHGGAGWYFKLDKDSRYRLKIIGNVKGNVTVYPG